MKEKNENKYINLKGIVARRSNYFFEKIIRTLFRKIDFDNESLTNLKNYENEGKVVYASFHGSATSLLILTGLLRKYKFNIPFVALGYSPYFLQMIASLLKNLKNMIKNLLEKPDYLEQTEKESIEQLLNNDKQIILSILSRKLFINRFVEKKSDSLEYIVEVQKNIQESIYIYPQMIFWNRNPERSKTIMSSKATGDKGFISALFTTLKSVTNPFIRISVPINLKEEIEKSKSDDAKHIAKQLRSKLLEIYNHEKRIVLGPEIKTQQETMEKVLFHKNIIDTIGEMKESNEGSEKRLRQKAYKYFTEIAADFSIVYIKYFKKILFMIFNRIFDGVSYKEEDFVKLKEASQKGPLILMPSHKSHMDYLIISSVFYHNMIIPPHILAGSNLTFFPMGKIFRRSGAFFMRRSFKGLKLYAIVFKQYIKTLISEGYSFEFFIEGGRSRTGKMLFPKMGILKYLIESIDEGYNKDLMFVPVTINYDRILEENSYHKELKGRTKKNESTSGFMKSWRLLKRKYGKVYLEINDPISFQDLKANLGETDDITTSVGTHIARKINEVMIVTPFALSTSAMLSFFERGFTKEMLFDRVEKLHDYLLATNAYMPEDLKEKSNLEKNLNYVIEAYSDDDIIERVEDESNEDTNQNLFSLNEDDRIRIGFYRNSIIHLFLPLSFVSIALLRLSKESDIKKIDILKDFHDFKDIFSNEFLYPEFMDEEKSLIESTLNYLAERSILKVKGTSVEILNLAELQFFGSLIYDYLESYGVTFEAIGKMGNSKHDSDKLMNEISKFGKKMYNVGSVKLIESISTSNSKNAVGYLVNKNLITKTYKSKKIYEFEIINSEEIQKKKNLLADMMSYIK